MPYFFLRNGKKQWGRFHNEIKKKYNQGYQYNAKFDIASFYDNIDHNVLGEILKKYGIEDRLIQLLQRCLGAWKISSNPCGNLYNKACGIPQGPSCSAFFAEVYLFPLDEIMRNYNSVCYFRYADDINIMAKSEIECRQKIVLLDLIVRELGLIPQSSKVEINKIDKIDKFINYTGQGFSKIVKDYKINAHITEKNHNRLKNKVKKSIECGDIDKTLFKFSLFKFNKDLEVKKLILNNRNIFNSFFDGVVVYFNKYYSDDEDVRNFVYDHLTGGSSLYKYNKALLFEQYENIPFSQEIINSNIQEKNYFWIVKYYMLDWLQRNGKNDLIKEICSENINYFIKRKGLHLDMKNGEIESTKYLLKKNNAMFG